MTDVAPRRLLRTNETRRRELDGLAAKGVASCWAALNATLRRAVANRRPAFAFVLPLLAVWYCGGLLLPGHTTDLAFDRRLFPSRLVVIGPVAYVVRDCYLFVSLEAIRDSTTSL